MQEPQRVKLWGFPGSCWAGSTHGTELIYIAMYRQTTFLCKACGQPLAGFAEHIPITARDRPWSTTGAALEAEMQHNLGQGHAYEVWIIQQGSHYGRIVGIFFLLAAF